MLEFRKELHEVFKGTLDGSIEPKIADVATNTAGKIIKSYMIDLVAEKMGSKIGFLEKQKCLKPKT